MQQVLLQSEADCLPVRIRGARAPRVAEFSYDASVRRGTVRSADVTPTGL